MPVFSSFPPGWIMLLIQRSPDVLIGPLTAPDGWRDSMGTDDRLRLLAGLLVALLMAVAWGMWRPPRGGGVKFSTATAFSYRNAHTRISRPRNPQNHTR